jgi:type 1 fimbriae regulatory protein FimB
MSPTVRSHRLDKIKFYTSAELRRLFSVIRDKRDRALFLLAYRHGLRASEVGLLHVTDIDLKTLRIMIHRLKGSLPGEHPLQPDEARALKAHLKARDTKSPILFTSVRDQPISRRGLDWLIKGYGKKAKLPDDKQHFHVLKHSIATHLLDAGADLRFVQDWLGHSNIQNTVIYTFLTSTTRAQTARAAMWIMAREGCCSRTQVRQRKYMAMATLRAPGGAIMSAESGVKTTLERRRLKLL